MPGVPTAAASARTAEGEPRNPKSARRLFVALPSMAAALSARDVPAYGHRNQPDSSHGQHPASAQRLWDGGTHAPPSAAVHEEDRRPVTRTAAQSRIFTHRHHSPRVAPAPTPNHPPSACLFTCPPTALPAVPMWVGPGGHAPETKRGAARCGTTSPLLCSGCSGSSPNGVPFSTARGLPRAQQPQSVSVGARDTCPCRCSNAGPPSAQPRPGGTGNGGRAHRPRRRAEALGPHLHASITRSTTAPAPPRALLARGACVL